MNVKVRQESGLLVQDLEHELQLLAGRGSLRFTRCTELPNPSYGLIGGETAFLKAEHDVETPEGVGEGTVLDELCVFLED